MATFLVAALILAAIINYMLALSHLKDDTAREGNKTWPKIIRLALTNGVTLMVFTYCFLVNYFWVLPTFHKWFSIEALFHAVIFFYIWLNVVFNYFAVVLTSPGKAYTVLELEEEGYSMDGTSICKRCNRLKMLGTGHCMRCGYCVRLISHHSHMLGNCIGLNNFSYFYLFLLYSCLGELYGISLMQGPFKSCVLRTGRGLQNGHCADMGDVAVIMALLIIGLIFTGSKLLFHTMLLTVDKSQREIAHEFKSCSSKGKYIARFLIRICKRRLNRHRLQHLIRERKPNWRDILLPSLNEPPIDLAAEDYIDFEADAEHMI